VDAFEKQRQLHFASCDKQGDNGDGQLCSGSRKGEEMPKNKNKSITANKYDEN